jgi:hypothetical protein
MDWSTIISVAAIVVFLWLMMRGCGGMMAGGGCGMGRPRRRDDAQPPESAPSNPTRRS